MSRRVLGQHFLVDHSVLRRIIEAADLTPEDTVLEVGPGSGMLTRELLRKVRRVVAIEIDAELARTLAVRLDRPTNLDVFEADARTVNLDHVLGSNGPYKVVANLPYYAANPIIRRFLEIEHSPTLMVVTVQQEVADAMVAASGKMGLLAVSVQLYGRPRIICSVPATAFRPVPKVKSAVVRMDLRTELAVDVDDVEKFFDLVRAGFSAPRKQIRNSLSQGLGVSPEVAEDVLRRVPIVQQRRPATLNLEEWAALYKAYRMGTSHES